ncbi:hypothetical protein [Saccharothrix deserti]|uniref:hypothetical protein n=1 Tax=Saccharothrix deserti TaxID=2593674 RepID=UPI00131D1733|nr:hypothetical protein [Saccharothrix deserti]
MIGGSKTEDNAGRDLLLGRLPDVELHLDGRSFLDGTGMSDRGSMDWWASAVIREFDPEDYGEDEQSNWRSLPDAFLAAEERPDSIEYTIFRMNGLKLDLEDVVDTFDALDARTAEYAEFIPLFADTRTYGFVDVDPGIEDTLELPCSEIVIVDFAELAPGWRGLGGAGRLLAGRLLRWLCSAQSCVALKPFPVELSQAEKDDPAIFDPALERVRHVWRSLGFKPFTDDLFFMESRNMPHRRAVQNLERRLGLRQ